MTGKLKSGNFEVLEKRAKELVSILRGKEVVILGHDNIDVDACLSGILMSRLLNFLNIKNQFCILEKVKENNTYEIITELIGINIKELENQQEDTSRQLFLVDHYETIHKGNVIGCIDHHPTQQVKDYAFKYVRNSCATAYLIYELMKELNFPIGKEETKMLIISMMVDTICFRSSKTIKEEVEQARKLARKYQFDYTFLEKYCLCLTPIDKISIEEVISNGQKWHNYGGNKVGSSYLQLYGLPDKGQLKDWLNCLNRKLEETCSSMLVFIIVDIKENKTYQFYISSNYIKEKVSDGILSRGKDIMPLIENYFVKCC